MTVRWIINKYVGYRWWMRFKSPDAIVHSKGCMHNEHDVKECPDVTEERKFVFKFEVNGYRRVAMVGDGFLWVGPSGYYLVLQQHSWGR